MSQFTRGARRQFHAARASEQFGHGLSDVRTVIEHRIHRVRDGHFNIMAPRQSGRRFGRMHALLHDAASHQAAQFSHALKLKPSKIAYVRASSNAWASSAKPAPPSARVTQRGGLRKPGRKRRTFATPTEFGK